MCEFWKEYCFDCKIFYILILLKYVIIFKVDLLLLKIKFEFLEDIFEINLFNKKILINECFS